PPSDTAEPMQPHEPSYAMAADPKSVGPQVLMNPRTPIATARRLVAGPNMREEPLILLRACTERTTAPGVIAAPGHREHATQDLHGIRGLLRLNEAIPHPDSLAKKATAFFRMSRSMRSCSTSRRKTLSSSVARKLLDPRGAPATCRIHRLNVGWGMPNSRATWHSLFPLRRHKSTASCLNSGVKLRRCWPMWHLPRGIMPGRCPQNQGKTNIREGTFFPEKFAPRKDITLRAWILRCLEGSTNRGIENERRYGRRWSLLLGKRLLANVSMEDLRQFQAKMRAKLKPRPTNAPKDFYPNRLWSDATINRHFAFLRHVLMLAVKDGKLTQNPVSGLKFFPEVKRTRF